MELYHSQRANFIAAVDWVITKKRWDDAAEMACLLKTFWIIGGYYDAGTKYLSTVLKAAHTFNDSLMIPKLNYYLGEFFDVAGNLTRAEQHYTAACKEVDDTEE
jgi:hypothetical protein